MTGHNLKVLYYKMIGPLPQPSSNILNPCCTSLIFFGNAICKEGRAGRSGFRVCWDTSNCSNWASPHHRNSSSRHCHTGQCPEEIHNVVFPCFSRLMNALFSIALLHPTARCIYLTYKLTDHLNNNKQWVYYKLIVLLFRHLDYYKLNDFLRFAPSQGTTLATKKWSHTGL